MLSRSGFLRRRFSQKPASFNMCYLQGFKKSLNSISKGFEFYCFYAFRMSNKATLDKFHEFGSRSIGDMVDIIYVIKPLLFWKNYLLYSINREYYISNTPWTKVMKLVLNSFILHSKCIDTIKFVPFWNWLEPFLEYLQKIHVNILGSLRTGP